MLAARQWRSSYHLSLFSMAATDLDTDQLILGPKSSHSACQWSFVSQLKRRCSKCSLQWGSWHLIVFDEVTISQILWWFFYVVILFQKSFSYITKYWPVVPKFQPLHWTVSVIQHNKSAFVFFLSQDFLEKWLFFLKVLTANIKP